MYEVAERFHQELIPQPKEIAAPAQERGKTAQADAVAALVDEILSRPEHTWLKNEKPDKPPRFAAEN